MQSCCFVNINPRIFCCSWCCCRRHHCCLKLPIVVIQTFCCHMVRWCTSHFSSLFKSSPENMTPCPPLLSPHSHQSILPITVERCFTCDFFASEWQILFFNCVYYKRIKSNNTLLNRICFLNKLFVWACFCRS